jgi:hypothetical protein
VTDVEPPPSRLFPFFLFRRRRGRQIEVASWRTLARNRLFRLRDELELAHENGRRRPEVFKLIETALADADQTLGQRGRWRGLRNWLTGIDIERVWYRLHEAEQLLFLVLDEDAVRAKVPGLRAEVALRLPRNDTRALVFATQLEGIERPANR